MKFIQILPVLFFMLNFNPNEAQNPTKSQARPAGQEATITSFYPFNQLFDWRNSRQSVESTSILPSLLTALLGVAASGRVAPVLGPILIKFLLIPLMALVKAVSRGMLFFGVISYLVSSFIPIGLSYLGLATGTTGFMGRAQQSTSWLFNPFNDLLNNRMSRIADGALNYMDMNSPGCKLMIACKVGKLMVQEYPGFTEYLKKYGITAVMETAAGNYTSTLLKAMLKKDEEKCNSKLCPTYRSFEGYLFNAADLTNSLVETTTTAKPITTTTTEKFMTEMKAAASSLMEMISRLSKDLDF